eukprot:SAG31_NODE_10461_length_1136_cov_0.914176_1_plen_148_part_10
MYRGHDTRQPAASRRRHVAHGARAVRIVWNVCLECVCPLFCLEWCVCVCSPPALRARQPASTSWALAARHRSNSAASVAATCVSHTFQTKGGHTHTKHKGHTHSKHKERTHARAERETDQSQFPRLQEHRHQLNASRCKAFLRTVALV